MLPKMKTPSVIVIQLYLISRGALLFQWDFFLITTVKICLGHNSSVTESVIVKPPIIYTIASNLKKGEWYQVCLYNSYVYRTVSDIPSSSCMNVEVHKSSNANPVVATPSQQTANYETIIGLVTGALIVLLILAIVTLLCWRNKRFIHEKKYQSPIGKLKNFKTIGKMSKLYFWMNLLVFPVPVSSVENCRTVKIG